MLEASVTFSSTVTIDALLRDMLPMPGERIKQWVVDSRRESAWEDATCPRFDVAGHDDNTGLSCRNVGTATWDDIHSHDCCYVCNEQAESAERDAAVASWLAEKAARPPIEADRAKWSDRVEPEPQPLAHPFFRWTP